MCLFIYLAVGWGREEELEILVCVCLGGRCVCVCVVGSPYQLLIIVGCRIVRVCVSAWVYICFVLSSWWSLTRITTRPKLYILQIAAAVQPLTYVMLQWQRCIQIHASAQAHTLTYSRVFDGWPEVMSASSCELLVLLTFLLSWTNCWPFVA